MEKKICRHPGCTVELKSNNKSGACTFHSYWAKKNPIGGAPAKTHAAKKPRAIAAPNSSSTPPQQSNGHATITVPESYLDDWFRKLPADQKATQFTAWLERGQQQ